MQTLFAASSHLQLPLCGNTIRKAAAGYDDIANIAYNTDSKHAYGARKCGHGTPSEASTPLGEDDGQRNVGCERYEQDDCDPGLQCGGQIGAGCHNVKQLRTCSHASR